MQAMDITYIGHSSFKIRGKHVTIITDPFNENAVGLKFPKNLTADIVTVSHDHDDHNFSSQIGGNPYVIGGPGEYEVKGISIYGIRAFHDTQKGAERGKNTMYRMEIDGMTVLHAGDLGHEPSDDMLEEMGNVNVLLIPVGGFYTIDAKTAAAVVHEIEPSVVIPMHFNRPELKKEVFSKLSGLDAFLKEIGKSDILPQAKLTVTKDKLPAEMQVVVLN